MVQFSETFYMDVRKVKPGRPEWHFNWSRQIQTNCALTALTFSKSSHYFYIRLPTLLWTTCIVKLTTCPIFFPRKSDALSSSLTASFICSHVCVYRYTYIHTDVGGVEEEGERKEYKHTHPPPYVNIYLAMN